MADLFGLDIAQLVADALDGQLRNGTLTRVIPGERDAANPTARTDATVSTFNFQGFHSIRQIRRAGELIPETVAVLTIIGNSVSPRTVPRVNDRAQLDGLQVELVQLIQRDPAEAIYEFRTQ